MSTTENKAVFLSYASQDAEAARRICDSLRSGGVEVWFDADGGLEHGDEWDAKIRRQIKECVLFIPVISASTQARHEGYFRIEWELAAQRALGIASGVPFILPVVIDDTREPDALVPDRFRMVQWTKLRGGEVPPDVQQRFLKLWSHRTGVLKHEATQASAPAVRAEPSAAETIGKPGVKNYALIAAAIAVIVGGAGWWMLHRSAPPSVASASPVPTKPAPAASEADQLVARAYALFDKMNYTRDNLAAAEDLTRRATEIASDSAHAWAGRAFVHSSYILRGWDISEKRRQETQTFANRALALNPNETDAMLALTYVLNEQGGFVQAEALARRALAVGPDGYRLHSVLIAAVRGQGREEEAAKLAAENVRLFPREPLTHYGLALGQLWLGHAEEALASFEAALAVQPFASALLQKTVLLVQLRGDLKAARATLDQVAPEDRTEDRAVGIAMWLALLEHNPARVQEAAARTARSYFEDNMVPGAKAWFTALAYQLEGKESLARQQWQAAETVLRQRLRDHPDSTEDHARLAAVLASLGRDEEAAREIAPLEAMMREQPKTDFAVLLAKYYAASGQAAKAAPHLSRAMDRRPFISRPMLRLDPQWDKLRGQPEFEALLAEPKKETAASPADAKSAPADKSVAVLAFVNQSTDKDNEYFSDGISEELLTVLQKIPGLHVAARTSAFSFKGKNATAQEIGTTLNVAHLVEGSVQKSGNRVKISARLSRVATGEQLWSENFTRDLADVFAVQSEIAQTIVAQLRGQLTGEAAVAAKAEIQAQVQAAEKGGTKNIEAHELYLQGKFFVNQNTFKSAVRATGLLRRAVELDPQFALAWAALSHAGGIRKGLSETKQDFDEGLKIARDAADRAMTLAPDLAAGHLAQAALQLGYDFDWKGAAESLRRATALAPSDPAVLAQTAKLAFCVGQVDRAVAFGRQAVALDPLNAAWQEDLADALTNMRRYEEAKTEHQKILELSPSDNWAHAQLSIILALQGKTNEAVAEAAKGAMGWERTYALAIVEWARGNKGAADAAVGELVKSYGDVAAAQIAWVYAFRHENDRAFEWLERTYVQHDSGLIITKANLLLESLHTDPRWPAFWKKIGLSDEQLK